jgi:hypothetical protein
MVLLEKLTDESGTTYKDRNTERSRSDVLAWQSAPLRVRSKSECFANPCGQGKKRLLLPEQFGKRIRRWEQSEQGKCIRASRLID